MKNPIYYNNEINSYLSVGEEVEHCDLCGKLLEDFGAVWQNQNVLEKYNAKILCGKCAKEKTRNHGISSIFICMLVDKLPDNSFKIHFSPIKLVDGKMDCFELASTNLCGEEVVDKTRQCHNPNFMKMSEFNPDHVIDTVRRVKELDSPVTPDFFEKTISAKPFFDKEQLENKEKKKELK